MSVIINSLEDGQRQQSYMDAMELRNSIKLWKHRDGKW